MFGWIKNAMADSRARTLAEKAMAVTECMSRFPQPVADIALDALGREILAFQAHYQRIDIISPALRLQLAHEYHDRARAIYATNAAEHCVLVLLWLWMETASIDSPIAATTHVKIAEIIATGVHRLEQQGEELAALLGAAAAAVVVDKTLGVDPENLTDEEIEFYSNKWMLDGVAPPTAVQNPGSSFPKPPPLPKKPDPLIAAMRRKEGGKIPPNPHQKN